jgi:hypothetical protein
MPLPAAGSETPEASIKTSRQQEERESENTPQKYELGKRVVDKQPLCAQVERKTSDNAQQQVRDSGAVMIVRGGMRYQEFCSAGVQKIQLLVQLRFIVTDL